MSESLSTYEAIARREKAGRKAAETLLESKSRELYNKHVELQKNTEQLEYSNSILSGIMATVPDSIILCTKEFVVEGVNKAAEDLLQVSAADIHGIHLDSILSGLGSRLEDLQQGHFLFEQEYVKSGGSFTVPVEVRGYKGPVGSNIHYLLVFNDISTRLKAEKARTQMAQQIDEARRLEAIGALSSGIAHEINTPIQFIGDNLDYLVDGLGKIYKSYALYEALRKVVSGSGILDFTSEIQQINEYNSTICLESLVSEIGEALAESRDGIRQVRDIVLLMKDFAHPGTGDDDETDLNIVIENVIRICRSRHKTVADIKLELDENLPKILCRKGQVQQVLLNIVINAIDAVADTESGYGRIRIQTMSSENYVSVLISDTGAGIPDSLRQKIFDPFFTTKPVGKGTGQGLALAKDCIIKGHDGKLTLVDIPGYATTFLICLPIQNNLLTNLYGDVENASAA
ncbi:ATP-binding protein [Parvularcula sp. IMCC14364]|uniref:PAS domain-containing sensor histidine kinase n=1 Tax=Parvularcula sp. IMCC14364 TaxID=3067902 RepID=UPI002741F0F0|nr:ATP-binding protein [Parvularcula sp. IMCC14364]